MKEYLDLALTFVRIGCMTFGGGYAMIPVLEREIIGRKGWITMNEVMDYYTIAQVTPGVIAINTATFIGCKRKGPLGGIIATLSFLAPGVFLMIIVSIFIRRFAEYPIVRHAFAGIRVGVGALIVDTVLKLLKSSLRDRWSVVLFVLGFGLSSVLSASPVLVIAGAGTAGFFLYGMKKNPPAGAGTAGPDAAGCGGADKEGGE
jgi:chromate transporter